MHIIWPVPAHPECIISGLGKKNLPRHGPGFMQENTTKKIQSNIIDK